MTHSFVIVKIVNCMKCPHCDNDRTEGAGYAIDYYCSLTPDPKATYKFKVIEGYVEWSSEEPKNGEIPDWCPLIPNKRSNK